MVRLNRNNYFYDFLLRVCRIIHDSVLVDENKRLCTFHGFCSMTKAEWRVSSRNLYGTSFAKNNRISKSDENTSNGQLRNQELHDAYLPGMETDTSLTAKDNSRKIVVETKYYKNCSRLGLDPKKSLFLRTFINSTPI